MARRDATVRLSDPRPCGRRRRLKKLVLIGLPLLLLLGGGSVVGLAALGFVQVPYLPFGKKKGHVRTPKDDGKGGPFASTLALTASLARQASVVPPPKPPPAPKPPDTGPGEERLASLWAEMPTDHLVTIVDHWPPAQLGRILALMDDEALTNLLAALPAPRATALSRAVAQATDERAAKDHPNGGK